MKLITESDVASAYLDSDGSLHLFDHAGNPLEGWPHGWPERIGDVTTFLSTRAIHYANPPRKKSLAEIVAEQQLPPTSDTPKTDEFRQMRRTVAEAEAFERTLESQLTTAQETIRLMRESHQRSLEDDSTVAACDCLTKTPDIQHHKKGCKYRLIVERDTARAREVALREALAKVLGSACPHPNHHPRMHEAWSQGRTALTLPAPPVVLLADVLPVIEALHDKECFGHPSNNLAAFLWKYPQAAPPGATPSNPAASAPDSPA